MIRVLNNPVTKKGIKYAVVSFLLLITLFGCGVSDDGSADSDNSSLNNNPPVAIAGNDQNVSIGQLVQLDGSASSDADNDSLSYYWEFLEKPDGSESNLSRADSINPVFSPDLGGTYVLKLIANDGQLDSNIDTVVITSSAMNTNATPIANAGRDQNLYTGQTVQLDGSASSDIDGDSLDYLWSLISAPTGSNSSLENTDVSNPIFVPDTNGTYVLQLIVNDGQVDSSANTVTITSSTANIAPVANAGPDQTVETSQLVWLDGTASSDANNDPLTYRWSLTGVPNGSGSSLISSTADKPTFVPNADGTYIFQLIVNDGRADSSVDTVTITSRTANIAPVANAGPDQTVETNQLVQLDGAASSDANNDPLNYSWSFTARPEGSNASLDNISIANPIFVPDADGTYVFSLLVNDTVFDSLADSVVIMSSVVAATVSDDFEGDNRRLVDYAKNGYTTNNENSLPGVTRTDGRYRAHVATNADDITLHYKRRQGRLDAKLVTFPFEYIARNIGIGTVADSQSPPPAVNSPYIFAGIQVHAPELDKFDSSHVVIGHRGGRYFTVEGKNTVSGVSWVSDEGRDRVPDGRADLRIVGSENSTLAVYWQQPNLTGSQLNDNWILYRGDGKLPTARNQGQPVYGDSVYIGLITYAQGSRGVPFVGTCDAIEFGN